MNTLKDGLFDAYIVLLASQQSHISALMTVLDNRIYADDSKEVLEDLVNKISDEFKLYFNSEEELMSVFLYDKILEKRNKHSQFLGKMKVFTNEYRNNQNRRKIQEILNEWLDYFNNEINEVEAILDKIEPQLEDLQDKFSEGNNLSVRVSVFDIQHRNIDFLLESIIYNLENNAKKEETVNLINNLYEKFDIHFALEEDLMNKHNFPNIFQHLDDHKRFLNLLKDTSEKYVNNTLPATPASIFEIIKLEVDNHIINVDKKYSDFFNNLGIM